MNNNNKNSGVADVLQASSGQPPILSEGRLTTATIRKFDTACKRFFTHKNIPASEQVSKILNNFDSAEIANWASNNEQSLTAGSFNSFMDQLKKKFLPHNWEDDLVQTQIAFQGQSAFLKWINDVRRANAELGAAKSDYFIADDAFRRHVIPRLSPDLRRCYESHNVRVNNSTSGSLDAISDLEAWLERINILDQDVQARQAELQALQTKAKPRTYNPSSSGSTSNAPSNPQSSSTTLVAAVPKLTADERALLMTHQGCLKCRVFYAGHFADKCSAERPSIEQCKKVTKENAIKAQAAFEKRKGTANVVVAAVFGSDSDTSSDADNGYGANEYVHAYDATAPVLPPSLPSPPDSSLLSPPDSPFPRHLEWSCTLDTPNGLSDSPVDALIDCGSPPVLISSKLVDKLGLKRRRLLHPLNASPAFSSDSSSGTSQFGEYCKIRVQSNDSLWKARTVRAIIVPNLHAPLILGLDFQVRNNLVLDIGARSVYDKVSNYDLIHPPIIPRATPLPYAPPASPKERRRKFKKELMEGQKATRVLRRTVHEELQAIFDENPSRFDFDQHTVGPPPEVNVIGLIKDRICAIAFQERLKKLDEHYKKRFHDCFPSDIPHADLLPTNVYHRIALKPGAVFRPTTRPYSCPRKYRENWKALIRQHEKAGRIRPSSSPYVSPSFIIPKADPTVLPRWVVDFRKLNEITVPDHFPLPRIDDILADCAKGKIWGIIDMTNSFFQTRVHPDEIKYTATLTPFGLWEWPVMPMGMRNSPATHQRRVAHALRDHIGKICHVYLDDIVIWSNSLEEHKRNIQLILSALRKANLYCSLKKSTLFATDIKFLGHRISQRGIEADPAKVDRVLNWPVPKSAKEVRRFLGLTRYISSFLPDLAEHTSVLNALTKKECNIDFPAWNEHHQYAFDSIKRLVLSRDCLTTIDHKEPGDNKIFVTCDASKRRTGAMLSFGPSWETARPVAFESRALKGAELNYPVHEQEMLAIVRALKRWKTDLIGSHIYVYTDHKTLQNFNIQKELSRRQARWMEFLSQFDYSILYINGPDNTVADALSRLPDTVDEPTPSTTPVVVAAVFNVLEDPLVLADIKAGYTSDTWCAGILSDMRKKLVDPKLDFQLRDGLLFIGDRLIVPKHKDLRERLFRLAHDQMGHFGGEKTYENLRRDFYWPNLRKDLLSAYVPSCAECQRNKSRTSKPPGPLHPLPVPDRRFSSVAIDFVGPLPKDGGFDSLVTMTDRLGADIQIAPCTTSMTAQEFANVFFKYWYCENGCPEEIITDRDKIFMSAFWRALMQLTGIKHKASTSFHPETDGSSERTNKTVVQCLRYHVERNQTGWVKSLPKVRFDIMNSVNASTGFSGFELKSGFSPRVLPPLIPRPDSPPDDDTSAAAAIISSIQDCVLAAQDALLGAKVSQAHQANRHRSPDQEYQVGDKVLLSTAKRRRDYMQKRDGRVAKFMPRWDGPYEIIEAFPEASDYKLRMPNSSRLCTRFHSSQLRPNVENDESLFPGRVRRPPQPVVTEEGQVEWYIDKILDERPRGRGRQYLVRWEGYGPEEDLWLPRSELLATEALAKWEKKVVGDDVIS
jgi:hypothetical protein